MLKPLFPKNDRTARWIIWILSILVFLGVATLSRVELDVELGFDVHVFAAVNATINSLVSLLLIWGFIEVRRKRFVRHRQIMISAICLSVLFFVFYILHHLFAGETSYGGEGFLRYFYYFILITHIFLAAFILPFILFTAYRALSADYAKHKRLARYTWPLWLYVSITGVLVYLLISPYYGT